MSVLRFTPDRVQILALEGSFVVWIKSRKTELWEPLVYCKTEPHAHACVPRLTTGIGERSNVA